MKRVSLQAYLVHLKVSSLHIFSEVEVNSLNVLPKLCNLEQVKSCLSPVNYIVEPNPTH